MTSCLPSCWISCLISFWVVTTVTIRQLVLGVIIILQQLLLLEPLTTTSYPCRSSLTSTTQQAVITVPLLLVTIQQFLLRLFPSCLWTSPSCLASCSSSPALIVIGRLVVRQRSRSPLPISIVPLLPSAVFLSRLLPKP